MRLAGGLSRTDCVSYGVLWQFRSYPVTRRPPASGHASSSPRQLASRSFHGIDPTGTGSAVTDVARGASRVAGHAKAAAAAASSGD